MSSQTDGDQADGGGLSWREVGSEVISELRRSSSSRAGQSKAARRLYAFAARIDQLATKNGLRTMTSTTSGTKFEEVAVTVETFSSLATLLGTVIAMTVLLLFAASFVSEFISYSPTVNQIEAEAKGVEHFVPDTAITLSMPNVTEEDCNKMFKLEFYWQSILDGMRSRENHVAKIEDALAGDPCGLQAGYNVNSSSDDRGSSPWPVFCVLDRKEKLRGRFGDPQYNYLQIKVNECSPGPNQICAPKEAREAWLKGGMGMNIWFRLQVPDFQGSRGLKRADGIGNGWQWFAFEKIWPNQTATSLGLELRFNRATLRSPWEFGFMEDGMRDVLQWFSFAGWQRSASGTTTSDFAGRTLLIVNTRVAATMNEISVKFMAIDDLVGRISGSWAVSLMIGGLLAMSLVALPCGSKDAQKAPGELGPLSHLVRPDIFGGSSDFLDEPSTKGVSSSKSFTDTDDEDFSDKNLNRSDGGQERTNDDKDLGKTHDFTKTLMNQSYPDKKQDAEESCQHAARVLV